MPIYKCNFGKNVEYWNIFIVLFWIICIVAVALPNCIASINTIILGCAVLHILLLLLSHTHSHFNCNLKYTFLQILWYIYGRSKITDII